MESRQDHIIEISVKQWEQLNSELAKLREENICLRQKFSKEIAHSLYKNRSFELLPNNMLGQIQQDSVQLYERKKFKKSMNQWSKKLNKKRLRVNLPELKIPSILQKKQKQQAQQQAQQLNLFKMSQQQNQKQQEALQKDNTVSASSYNGVKLIQSICLYGPKQQQILQQFKDGKFYAPNQLLYCNSPEQSKFGIYGSQLFSEQGVPFKKIRQSQIAANAQHAIFRKNVKMDCSILLFRTQQQNRQLQQQNYILQKANAIKLLTTFVVKFTDFVFVECEENEESKSPNKSMENKIKLSLGQQDNICTGQESNRERSPTSRKKICIKTQYCFCLFTYFPIINLMQQLVASTLNEIKIRRVQKYAIQNSTQKVSIKHFIFELHRICTQLSSQISSIPMQLGVEVSIAIGHFKIVFNFLHHKLDYLFYSSWIFDIMKLFDRDTLYEIFTNIMTEESVCFVCQNSKLLTYVVFFFTVILPNPFCYPHPCITKAFRYQLIESPFVLTMGINQSSKWIQENANDKKIFVDLNDGQVKIKGSRKLKTLKSERLKKIFHNFYKKLEGSSPMPQFFKKKVTIIKPADKQQNELVYTMLKNLQQYYKQQIFNHLPNPQIIQYIRQKSPQRNEHSKLSLLMKEVQKYLKQSRKQRQKDYFIEALIQQQIFYMYISKYYSFQ